MTWTRLDDTWTDDQVLAELSFADRWHYLAMIQFCSRTKKYDGILRPADARRCSDHPEPGAALSNLEAVGLVINVGNGYKLPLIDDHIPPPSVREASEKSKVRMRRMRQHKEGNHADCLPKHCDQAPTTGEVTGDVTRNTGTGQDGTGRASDVEEVQEVGVQEVPQLQEATEMNGGAADADADPFVARFRKRAS